VRNILSSDNSRTFATSLADSSCWLVSMTGTPKVSNVDRAREALFNARGREPTKGFMAFSAATSYLQLLLPVALGEARPDVPNCIVSRFRAHRGSQTGGRNCSEVGVKTMLRLRCAKERMMKSGYLFSPRGASRSRQSAAYANGVGEAYFTERPLLLFFLCLALAVFRPASVWAGPLDIYGGDINHACPGGATGYFYTYHDTASQHWWFCDPAGNRFFMLAVEVVGSDDAAGYGRVMTKKYGDDHYGGYSHLLSRLQFYRFNTVGDGSSWYALPVETNAGAGNSVKLPFIWQLQPSNGYANPTYPFKDVVSALSDAYTGYRKDSLADVFDPNWTHYANSIGSPSPWGDTQPFPSFSALDASPWLLGISIDNGDRVWGFKDAQKPDGVPSAGWMAATTAPYQIYSGRFQTVYSDPNLYVKQEFANWLQQTEDAGPGYTSIAALNATWGADYSTFGSSGTAVTREVIGTGNGSTTSFTHTLAHVVVDPWSVAILVNGSTLGGDCPWFDNFGGNMKSGRDCATGLPRGVDLPSGTGTLGGANMKGIVNGTVVSKIDYIHGTITVVFNSPPASGASITANYIFGGWPRALTGGTGVLDEDGTSPWFPSPFLDSTRPQPAIDLNNFLGQVARQYFSSLASAVRAKLPHHLVFSQNFLGAYDSPIILQQAGNYLDALIFQDVEDSSQLATAYGYSNKPAFLEARFIANPDSPLSAYRCDSENDPPFACQPTQKARGQAYSAQFAVDLNLVGADQYGFIIGWDYWEMTDKTSEHQNFGLWDAKDNAYNGAEDRSGPQPCAPETSVSAYVCGQEPGNYGDFLDAVAQANASWYAP
jgi:hypothetical protein